MVASNNRDLTNYDILKAGASVRLAALEIVLQPPSHQHCAMQTTQSLVKVNMPHACDLQCQGMQI
jgi:hypothetical protein